MSRVQGTLKMRGPSGRCGRRGMFAAVAATAVKKESNPPHPLLKKKPSVKEKSYTLYTSFYTLASKEKQVKRKPVQANDLE